jgi:multidrug/hemolysin transport system permease protein
MNIVMNLINRNLKMFLRNRAAVFFSFLSVIIIIGLYALFLGDTQIQNIESIVGKRDGIRWMTDSWVMAGIIAVNTITISLGSLGVMIDDIERGTNKDFLSSPIKRSHVVLGYVIATWILGIVISILALFFIELYIVSSGGHFLSFVGILQMLGLIVLSVISYSSILFFLMTYIKTANAFAAFSSIIGTAVGFLAGVYVPIGVLPNFIQKFVSVFPFSYSPSLMRQVFMNDPLTKVFNNADPKAVSDYEKLFGVKLYLGDFYLTPLLLILGLLTTAAVFYILSIYRLLRMKD